MPSVDGHVVHGEAVRSLHKDHFSFWTKDRYEFQLISSARSSKSETSHSFWSAKEPNNYLPYLTMEHTLKQRMAISDTLDLVCEAEGRSAGSTSTSITVKQTSSKKQGFGFTPTLKFERKGTVASGSFTHEIGNSSNWTSIHVRATAPVSWPEAVFSREFVQDFGLPGAVQVLWQRGALRAAGELEGKSDDWDGARKRVVRVRCGASYSSSAYGLLALTLEKKTERTQPSLTATFSKYVTPSVGLSLQAYGFARPKDRGATVAAVWYPQAGIKVLANANTWQQANATVEYQVGPEWRLQAGLSYDHAGGSQAGVRLSFWPKKLSTWDNAYN